MNPKWKRRNPNTPARRAKRAAAAMLAKAMTPKTYKASGKLQQAVKQVLKSAEETKYVAQNILSPAIAVPAAQTTPVNFARIMPFLTQGVGDFQRIGDKVTPVRACTYWTVFPDPAVTALYDITLNLVVVKVKGASTDVAVAAIPGTDFLRVGNGGNTDPNDPNQETMLTDINRYPVNTERYTVLKHFKHRFCKGPNSIQGPVGAGVNNAPPTGGPASPIKVFKYSWVPPRLLYDNAAATLPTNHYPVYLIWATANDASGVAAHVKFAVRSEMYYKDS